MTHDCTQSTADGDAPTDVKSVERFEELLVTGDRVLINFYADWSRPCQMMTDTVNEFAAETDATVLKINVEQLPQVASEYEVRTIPAFVVVEDGEPIDRLVGVQEKADLGKVIES